MITTWSRGPADDCMPQSMLVDSLDKVRRHPWWLARARLATALLRQQGVCPPASIDDVGCGWGVNLEVLATAGFRVTGFDISRQILELIDRPDRQLVEADLTQPFPAGFTPCDALIALDVIEHLDDDQAAIGQMAQLVRPQGLVVVSVPALPELFSEYDQMQGHRRRYLPETFQAAFVGSGLTLRSVFWWGQWMVPILRRTRRQPTSGGAPATRTYTDYLRLPPWPLPWLMSLAYAWEESRALRGRLRTGTSLFAVASRSGP
jgi:SAM-dependent methyltransferase